MNTVNLMKDLFKHMNWADALVYNSLKNFTEGENDAQLKRLIYHLHLVQHAFYYIWSDQPLEFPKESEFESLNHVFRWGFKNHEKLKIYFDRIKESDLNRIIIIPWSKRVENKLGKPPENTSLGDTMLQVISHSTYHRGQVNARLRILNFEPALVDYIAWAWLGKPEAEWPETVI